MMQQVAQSVSEGQAHKCIHTQVTCVYVGVCGEV